MKFILTFDDYNQAWHESFQQRNQKWRDSGMYTRGQFDEIPFAE